ncbi:3-keto-5-aminohexanoate cleavage protein [Enterovirga rhinocerotis]|uniref:3-keto-5-aminohexanoate cleavage protein n=1 Tax=Enterovirga rhinocerotis TaxID=1339210 RepID=UPI00315CDDD7
MIVSCAVTGGSPMTKNSRYVPITPKRIAEEALAAARAGAAVVHIHVRDPETGAPGGGVELFREVVSRIRDSGSDVVINLTTGPGARFDPPIDDPRSAEVMVRPPDERVEHVVALRPEICSLDIATMNFGASPIVNSLDHIRHMARAIYEAGVKPELEVFDLGQVGYALYLIEQGIIEKPPFFQFCLGIRGGAPATTEAMTAMKNMLPAGTVWSAFGISRSEFPMVAQSVILGGHVRVGLEDNLFIAQGELAEGNAPLVERAVTIVTSIGEDIASPADARRILSL